MALFKAFFTESRNIGDRNTLINLAKENGLDIERFNSDLDQSWAENEVMADYEDGQAKYAAWGVPLAIIDDRYPVMGASPTAVYRRAIDLSLANRTG
jgi:predicted DsbA family dithiol-disulfide isomerase